MAEAEIGVASCRVLVTCGCSLSAYRTPHAARHDINSPYLKSFGTNSER